MKKGFLSFFLFTAFAWRSPSCKDDETARMEKRRVLGSVQPRPRKRDHPLRREHGRVHRNDRRQMDLCDRPEQDRLVHPPHRRRHDAGDSDSGKHREQGALRRSPVHLGLGPHAGRGVHHHAGTRTCAARSAESRPARRCLPRRRHGRGRIAAQERGALLPRHGADPAITTTSTSAS